MLTPLPACLDNVPEVEVEVLVVVSGPPASGKSELAGPLAGDLGLPLLTKDTIKESLFDSLGIKNAAWSARLSDASYEVMFALAGSLGEVVLEANFRPQHGPRLLSLAGAAALLEVHCVCAPEERSRRWSARRRHPGHLDVDHPEPPAAIAPGPLALGPVLEVDTAGEVDLAAVVSWVRGRGI